MLGAQNRAVAMRDARGVDYHLDHVSQDTALAFGKRCEQLGILQSLRSVGVGYDHAMTESFFATLEKEPLARERLDTHADAHESLDEKRVPLKSIATALQFGLCPVRSSASRSTCDRWLRVVAQRHDPVRTRCIHGPPRQSFHEISGDDFWQFSNETRTPQIPKEMSALFKRLRRDIQLIVAGLLGSATVYVPMSFWSGEWLSIDGAVIGWVAGCLVGLRDLAPYKERDELWRVWETWAPKVVFYGGLVKSPPPLLYAFVTRTRNLRTVKRR